MPKVVIMSDSHGLTKEIAMIKERENAPYIFHCGDSELNDRAKELEGVFTVSGNCDFNSEFPNEIIKEIGGLTFLVVHGHLHNVKMNLLNLSYYADEVNADIICFGHSHIAGSEKVSDKLFLNPGSIRLPRMRTEKTYCVLEWEERDSIAITYRTVDGEIVEELSYTTALD